MTAGYRCTSGNRRRPTGNFHPFVIRNPDRETDGRPLHGRPVGSVGSKNDHPSSSDHHPSKVSTFIETAIEEQILDTSAGKQQS